MTERRHPIPSEARLYELFAALARLEPAAGFVDRVMASLPGVRRRSWFDSRWTRAALAAALVGVALSTALLVPTAFSALRAAGPGTILSTWIGAVADLFAGIGASLGTWERLAGISRAFGVALAQPKALLILVANAALAALAFRGLVSLSPRRGKSHVALAS
jgi:hypothetical protein